MIVHLRVCGEERYNNKGNNKNESVFRDSAIRQSWSNK